MTGKLVASLATRLPVKRATNERSPPVTRKKISSNNFCLRPDDDEKRLYSRHIRQRNWPNLKKGFAAEPCSGERREYNLLSILCSGSRFVFLRPQIFAAHVIPFRLRSSIEIEFC
ncbi:MAG: hypothetical protein JST84_12780 [Acidobacteria bacterium]|nr:hypothetical protein [Acidobacteriota bacterium]